MALVERHSEQHARQHGSHGSLPAPERSLAPASDGRAQTPERRFSLERHPVAKLALKAAGIAGLLLGLAGIGALSMKKGFGVPKLALADTTHPAISASGIAATHASLLDSAPASAPSAMAPLPPASSTRSAGLTEDGRVILNLATLEDLRHLPGVGQKRAEAILALRQKLGRFKRPGDLLRIRGIGARRLKQLLPKLVVDAPSTPATPTPATPTPATPTPATPTPATPTLATPTPATPTPATPTPPTSAPPRAAAPAAAPSSSSSATTPARSARSAT